MWFWWIASNADFMFQVSVHKESNMATFLYNSAPAIIGLMCCDVAKLVV